MRSPLRKTVVGHAAIGLVLLIFRNAAGRRIKSSGLSHDGQPVHLLTAHLIYGVLWFQWCLLSVNSQPAAHLNRKAYV